MSNLPTGTVTFLFTDIEGSTALWEQHPEAMKLALERHDVILRQAIESQGGYVFKTVGDAFCAAFSSAPNALAACLYAQRSLQNEAFGETPIKVRMGMHTGLADERDGDYFGATISRVARIMSLASGQQILLSAATAELLRGFLPAGTTMRDMGQQRLKGLLNPEHLCQVVAPDLPQDFPPLQSLNAIPNNLPIQVTSFVGRELELIELQELLPTTRLLTLTGAGGTGKTRLSIQLAANVLETFKDGVWFVELAPLSDPALVPATLASVLGIPEFQERPLLPILLNWLNTRQLLLILDNCEHLIEACAALVDAILHASRGPRVVATSREALGIAGETTYRVPSLPGPDSITANQLTAGDLEKFAAVRLFTERAKQALPAFRLNDANALAVAQICLRLDGIPLAIELAAARMKTLSAEQIAERLGDRFRLLTGGSRTALPRQQTLRALVDWSHNLLTERERVVLRRLSVFSGGWTLEAAEQVVAGGDVESVDVLDLLGRLVDKSLVVTSEAIADTRYSMLETIRQYALAKLLDSGEAESAKGRHLEYFVTFSEIADPKVRGPEQKEWVARLDLERDNWRAALDWAIKSDAGAALRLAWALRHYWTRYGYVHEARESLERLLPHTEAWGPSAARARALNLAGFIANSPRDFLAAQLALEQSIRIGRQTDARFELAFALGEMGRVAFGKGDASVARSLLEEGLTRFRALNDAWYVAFLLVWLGAVVRVQGDYGLAQSLLDESIDTYRQLGDRASRVFVLNALGGLAQAQGDYDRSAQLYAECVELAHEFGFKGGVAVAASNLGFVLHHQGRERQAAAMFKESLVLLREFSSKEYVLFCLAGLAGTLAALGNPRQAALLLGATEAGLNTSTPSDPADRVEYDFIRAGVRAQMTEPEFEHARAEGHKLSTEDAIARALGALPSEP